MKILNYDHKLTNKDLSNFEHSKIFPRHNWYFFKEGFSPLLVEEAINSTKISDDGLIIDPFCGSGTTSLVASVKNKHSIGFEVNPFLAFVARTKQLNENKKNILRHKDSIFTSIEKGSPSLLENFSTFTKGNRNEDKWLFNLDVLRSFEGGWQYAESLPNNIKNIFKLSLIASIMDNCNAEKDGKCLRYKKNWRIINFSKNDFLDSFEKKIEKIICDLEKEPIVKKSNIILGDSRKNISQTNQKFQLCVTSPPYLNSFDYSDIYRPELFLGKFILNNNELNQLRLKTLRSHVQIIWDKPTKIDFGLLYPNVINEIARKKDILWNNRLMLMIQAYFEDMENILTQLKHKADKNASLWLVVSTSAYAGVEIPVDLILADIGTKVGWDLEEIIVMRYLRNSVQNAKKWLEGEASSKQLRESIVILRA